METCCSPSADRDPSTSPAALSEVAGGKAPGMESLPGGTFSMGTDDPKGYPVDGEGPEHDVELPAFSIGTHAVTNREFKSFVAATGYVTTAEKFGNSFVFAGLLPDDFPPTQAVVGALWWRVADGADWQHPEGPHSDVTTRQHHPVVHVSWFDAMAFCSWSGTRLPSEAEWEYAARGGISGHHFPWGDEREPDGEHRMNVFQGTFPAENSVADGWAGTCPVGTFPANGYGLHEMTGNVWEWCADWFDPAYYRASPRVAPSGPDHGTARVIRGGSYLCHDSYCWRYRVDSRSANSPDSSTGNMGFRVASD